MKKYDIFISYRREGGMETATRLRDTLAGRGYRVFLDIESLRAGDFNEQLYRVIENSRDFLLILPPNSLDRCADTDDWVRKEIIHAKECGKNIIPVMLRGFTFPEWLPDELEFLRSQQGIAANVEYYDAFVDKLERLFKSRHGLPKWLKWALLAAAAALIGASVFLGSRYMNTYPRNERQRNLVSSVITYLAGNLGRYDSAAQIYLHELDRAENYIAGKTTDSAVTVRFSIQQAITDMEEFARQLADLPPSLSAELMGSPFDAGDLMAVRSGLAETLSGYIGSLRHIRDNLISDEYLRDEHKILYLGILQEIAALDGEMMFYLLNEALLPVTDDAALAALKNDLLPAMTTVYTKGLYLVRDADTLSGRERGVYLRYEQLMARLQESLAVEEARADNYIWQQEMRWVESAKQNGWAGSAELEAQMSRIEEMQTYVAEREAQIVAMQQELDEKRSRAWEEYKPLETDDLDLLWNKGIRFLTMLMPDEAAACFEMYENHCADPLDALTARKARLFCRYYYQHGVESGVITLFYEENLPHQAVEIGDVIFEVNGVPVRNYQEYMAQAPAEGVFPITLLRLSDTGYEIVSSVIDRSLGRIGLADLTEQLP